MTSNGTVDVINSEDTLLFLLSLARCYISSPLFYSMEQACWEKFLKVHNDLKGELNECLNNNAIIGAVALEERGEFSSTTCFDADGSRWFIRVYNCTGKGKGKIFCLKTAQLE